MTGEFAGQDLELRRQPELHSCQPAAVVLPTCLPARPPQSPLPGLVVGEAPLLLKVSEEPCLLLADGFLSRRECAALRTLGQPLLKRSKVSAGELLLSRAPMSLRKAPTDAPCRLARAAGKAATATMRCMSWQLFSPIMRCLALPLQGTRHHYAPPGVAS